jgi:endonuclease III
VLGEIALPWRQIELVPSIPGRVFSENTRRCGGKAIEDIFRKFPDIFRLAQADESEIAETIAPLGLTSVHRT